ncbi:hypothetical protein MRX96_046991 [Rhipicephalus microplus]
MRCAFSLPNITQPYIMVRLCLCTTFFSFVVCNNHPFYTVPDGGITCTHHNLHTPAGTVTVGCDAVCNAQTHIKATSHIRKDCVTVVHEAVTYMHSGVNYTCELGACDSTVCKPYDLLIGCWKD